MVTGAMAARLSSDCRYVASDLNQPMLYHAAKVQARAYHLAPGRCFSAAFR